MQTVLLWFYSHKWPLHVSDIYTSIFRSSYIQGCFTAAHHMWQWNNLVYKNSWRWTCKCPKHVEAIYENKIIVKLFASSWYIFLLKREEVSDTEFFYVIKLNGQNAHKRHCPNFLVVSFWMDRWNSNFTKDGNDRTYV